MLIPLTAGVIAAVLHPAPPTGVVSASPPMRTILIDRDNVEVTESCVLAFAGPLSDKDGNGIVRIVAEGIVVDLGGAVLASGVDPARRDQCVGIGIVVAAKRVTLRNGGVRGFKVGIAAESCDGAVFERLDVSDNYAAKLRSTKEKEDESDWLYPHENDEGQQVAQHGAGLSVVLSKNIVVREIRASRTQNGIVLRRVDDAQIYDNDCSFLSGWGLAMWRSSRNTVCRNSFDFCIRGYSHGVYNRGQDSAGILMFEQCSDNIVALNSATHSGDGVFGFAGREALGEKPFPSSTIAIDDPSHWYRGRGCNGNLFALNDLSYAAAHGLEMTFSFGNRIVANRFAENGINGLWAGYARDFVAVGNEFLSNVQGGIAAEHAQRCSFVRNTFVGGPVGVAFWDDEDPGLVALPWTRANGSSCVDNAVLANIFRDEPVAIALREAAGTRVARNVFERCEKDVVETRATGTTAPLEGLGYDEAALTRSLVALDALPGVRSAVGARVALRGRDKIVMGEFGPIEPTASAATKESIP